MDPKHNELRSLIRKYIEGRCTSEEILRLDTYMKGMPQSDVEEVFAQVWESLDKSSANGEGLFSAEDSRKILDRVFSTSHHSHGDPFLEDSDSANRSRVSPMWKGLGWVAACSIAFLIGFFWFDQEKTADTLGISSREYVSEQYAENIGPGQNEAVLTTDGGSTVLLSGDSAGVISEGIDFKLVRLASGDIQYQGGDEAQVAKWHTVTTPRGGQINLILPDGSKVWLNAASSIRFKSDMGSKERKVIMQGEVYFEVERAKDRNFLVEHDFGRIEVLGTKFNVNAYDPEHIQTALLEGAVRLQTDASVVEMKPHQLATINALGKIQTVYKENISDLIAWTAGEFFFEDAGIKSIAAQLSRWYNVETTINPTPIKVTGKIARNIQLSQMIDMLDYLGMPCIYRDKKLIMNAKK